MQYRVDCFIPKAFEAIENVRINDKGFIDKGSIPKEYKGYIASLGANIIQAGIRAALIFYEEEESGSKSDKRLINAAIKYIISNSADNFSDYKLSEVLKDLSLEEQQKKAEEIMDAATALKLALRTYKMK
ncbi:type III-B CRISPR module-associated protein Cmr5 [Anaerorudis cellulosivorans]|uniref:type III-B CRISPR module-associated protein Cmr5 n=1 Tax=Anaerorudis cellulosivorans TaxID=3397862 RepID=UPI00221F84B6|nr:type III-B CRISPR module-associated protein Cmr5 [Seramator thermalis]MCW1735721.1 type III-B CRISPR module-associated protein Cmr5 [Seramator thermalis]